MMKGIIRFCAITLIVVAMVSCDEDQESPFVLGDGQNVIGGSLNRFSVSGDHLYIINDESLIPFSLDNPAEPKREDEIFLGLGIETLITRGNELFIGAQDGMHIFDITVPGSPKFLSTYQHIISCDPVAVQGDVAYVTLRRDTDCRRGRNSLDIVDISNLRNPREIKSISLDHSPHGLGVRNESLFVTGGNTGVTEYRLENPFTPIFNSAIRNLHFNDVIVLNDRIILTGRDGVHQYSYGQSLSHLSTISFTQ